jgi:hypothetical protein
MPIDRFESTFVVDIKGNGDFTSLQLAIEVAGCRRQNFRESRSLSDQQHDYNYGEQCSEPGRGNGHNCFRSRQRNDRNTPALQAFNAGAGTIRPLVADTALGDTTFTTSPADAASFAAGDYILLYSDKVVDTEITTKHAGEIKQITSVDPTSGSITVDDEIFDIYTLADSAQVVRITMLQNITLSDFLITTTAPSSTLNVGFTHFRFIENLQIQRIQAHTLLMPASTYSRCVTRTFLIASFTTSAM